MSDSVESQSPQTNAPIEGSAPAEGMEASAPSVEIPKPPVDKFSSKFAALTRKEREFKAQMDAFKKERDQLMQERQEWEQTRAKTPDLIAEFKKNPIKWAEQNGVTYDELIQMGLNEGNPTMEMQMRRMREEIETKNAKEIEELRSLLKEKEEKEAKERVNSVKQAYLNHIGSTVEADAEKYELIKLHNDYEYVFSVVENVYEQTGQEPDLEQILESIEQEYEAQARKFAEAKKFKPKVQEVQEPKVAAPTLSNTVASQVPVNTGDRQLSRSELIAHHAKRLRYQA